MSGQATGLFPEVGDDKPSASTGPVSAKHLLEMLRGHYIKAGSGDLPGGIFLTEVSVNGSAFHVGGSRADAIFVGFTSTSGRMLVGHEVKASRADWLRELQSPGKADFWCDQCHEWWIVAPPGVVSPDELPPGWGLMLPPATARSRRMRVKVRATKHPDRTPSWDAVRSVMARYDTLRAQEILEARKSISDKAYEDFNERVDERIRRDLGHKSTRVEELEAVLKSVCDAMGVERIVPGEISWGNNVSAHTLRRLGDAARKTGSLERALADLAGPMLGAVSRAVIRAAQLEAAITDIKNAAIDASESDQAETVAKDIA